MIIPTDINFAFFVTYNHCIGCTVSHVHIRTNDGVMVGCPEMRDHRKDDANRAVVGSPEYSTLFLFVDIEGNDVTALSNVYSVIEYR